LLEKIYLLQEPLAAAMGMGLEITSPVGSLIIDIRRLLEVALPK
jgi:actin-like ATPase involved in cell morphogenesis